MMERDSVRHAYDWRARYTPHWAERAKKGDIWGDGYSYSVMPEEWLLYHNPSMWSQSNAGEKAMSNVFNSILRRTLLENRLNIQGFYSDANNVKKLERAAVINNSLLERGVEHD